LWLFPLWFGVDQNFVSDMNDLSGCVLEIIPYNGDCEKNIAAAVETAEARAGRVDATMRRPLARV